MIGDGGILHNLAQRKSSGNSRRFVKGLTGAKSLVATHVALLPILGISGSSASSTSDGCPDEGSGSGIAISDIVADNGARYATKGGPGGQDSKYGHCTPRSYSEAATGGSERATMERQLAGRA